MTTPSPYESAFKWARYLVRQYSTGFWVSTVLLSLAAALVTSRVPLPKNPTASDNFLATAAGIVCAGALVFTVSYGIALLRAPYKQRDQLRAKLTTANSAIAGLNATPAPARHAASLRSIARGLRKNIEELDPLDYGPDAATLKPAFHQHFPDVQNAIDGASRISTAFVALKGRIATEVVAAGMNQKPWTPETYSPWLATTIQARALQRVTGAPFAFPWHSLGPGSEFMEEPVYGNNQVLVGAKPDDVPALKAKFEALFRKVEASPETAEVVRASEGHAAAQAAAVANLAAIANTDPITSKCFLCDGAQRGD